MVSFLKLRLLLCLPLLFFALSCAAVSELALDDLAPSCPPHLTSAEPFSMSEVFPGRSLMQAYVHRSDWRTADVQRGENMTDWKPQDFRTHIGEFGIGVSCFILLICGCVCCRSLIKQTSRQSGASHAEGHVIAHRWARLVHGAVKHKHGADVAGPSPASPTMQSLAFKEESDAGDWLVDESWKFGQDDAPVDYDPEGIPKYVEAHFGSWSLLITVLGALAQFWGALAFMYWSLLHQGGELMDCDAYPASGSHYFFVTHTCHYTRACLQGFPVLAANMVLVLMVRTLLQTRFYYSMLRLCNLVVYQNVPVTYTLWPWFIAFSMFQGSLHFVLKAYFDPEDIHIFMWLRLVKKFALPGAIFFIVLFRYADVENTLVPLNHIAELEVTTEQDTSPWLANMKILNERVIAFDVRHRDVYSDTVADLGRLPGLNDIVQNIMTNYESAKGVWSTQIHRNWGLFRSMWPAALMLDRRLDWNDQETRSWLLVASVLVVASSITSLLSVFSLLSSTSRGSWIILGANMQSVITGQKWTHTACVLGLVTIVGHALMLLGLLYYTVLNMFYFSFSQAEIDRTVKNASTASRAPVERAMVFAHRMST